MLPFILALLYLFFKWSILPDNCISNLIHHLGDFLTKWLKYFNSFVLLAETFDDKLTEGIPAQPWQGLGWTGDPPLSTSGFPDHLRTNPTGCSSQDGPTTLLVSD